MKVKIREEISIESIEVGDAIVFNSGDIRVIVKLAGNYGAFSPVEGLVYYPNSPSIESLLSNYDDVYDIVRIISKDKLELVEK